MFRPLVVASILAGSLAACSPPSARHEPPPAGAAAQRRFNGARALPYARGYQPPLEGRDGVVVYDRKLAQPGLNLLTSGHAAQAELIDMAGRERHRWRLPLAAAFPELLGDPDAEDVDYWRRVQLLADGSLLAIYEGYGLVKLDRGSRLLWARRGGFHHDLFVDDDGTIFVLERESTILPHINPRAGVVEDFVTHLAADGARLERFSILEAFERSPFAAMLAGMPRRGDLLHTNTLERLDGSLAARSSAFRAGNLLISARTTSTLAVIDPAGRRVVWALRGAWRRQHEPSLLPSGRLLLFDNVGIDRDHSRVVEVDPRDGQILWQYGGRAGEELSSRTLGCVQRLANGNTLISESRRGRAIEVTPDGRIVWEYRNPYRIHARQELVATLFSVARIPALGPARGRDGAARPPG